MTLTTLQLFKTLSKKFGDAEAEALTTFIREDIKEEFELRKEIYATKEDLYKVKDELHKDFRQIMWALIVLILPLYALIVFQILKSAA